MDATGGVGKFGTGDTHESHIGDQNGNGVLEWVAGFSYRPWGEDGIDNDGDGCVDEKTYGDWDGQVGCDLIPDQITYYETGGLGDAGGDDGNLLSNVDWYSSEQTTEIWRAFVSPKWMAYQLRGFTYYPQMAGEFVSYYANEELNKLNANPEMDDDKSDWYVGNIDARGFPSRAPSNYACAAGYQLYMGITFLREDGWVVTSFELREYYDDHDWNMDGDKNDEVAAYYAVDPLTGKCRNNAVNTGVQGNLPRNSGEILTPSYTFDAKDSRDWGLDGASTEITRLYHDINTTWHLKGKIYTSVTFTAPVPSWGFGWWAVYSVSVQNQAYPLKFGGAFSKNLGAAEGYYHAFFFLTSDEDGNRHTEPPHYEIGYGYPTGSPGGVCVQVLALEAYLEYAGVKLMNNKADGNGDDDTADMLILVFCPDESGGGGGYIIENTSKFANGLYQDPIPYIAVVGVVYYSSSGTDSNGLCIMPYANSEATLHDDADGNLIVDSWYHAYYWIDIDNLVPGFVPGRTQTKHDTGPDRPTGHPSKMNNLI
jgi:hypothetical protein